MTRGVVPGGERIDQRRASESGWMSSALTATTKWPGVRVVTPSGPLVPAM